jgi:DNA polymerase III epsilon subunit-like protein
VREIVIDTETTGLGLTEGHRIVEVGAVELVSSLTGGTFHCYLCPQRAFNRPLVYRIDGEGHAPVIMTMSRALSE